MNNDMNNNVNPAMNFGIPQPDQNSTPMGPTPVPPAAPVGAVPPVGAEATPMQQMPQAPVGPVPTQPQPIPQTVTPVQTPEVQQPTPVVTPEPVMQPVSPQPTLVDSPVVQPVQPTPVDNSQAPVQSPQMQQPVSNVNTTEISGTLASGSDNLDGTEKKKTPVVMILITILVVAGVGVFLFLYLTGKINFGGNSSNGEETVDTGETTVELASWMNYLLEQNITEVKLTRTTEDGSGDAEVVLTTNQLREVFTNMMNYNLIKGYTSGTGFTYGDVLSITYGDENYNLEIAGNWFRSSNLQDQNLLDMLDTSVSETRNEENKDEDGNFVYYLLNDFDTSIYDGYFTTAIEEETVEENTGEVTE